MSSVPWCGHSGLLRINHQTRERTKQPVRDPAREVVSGRFKTNPGAIRLRCESERTSVRSSSKNHTPLFGRNGHPLGRTHYKNYCLISGNSKISRTLSDRRVIVESDIQKTFRPLDIGYPALLRKLQCEMEPYQTKNLNIYFVSSTCIIVIER